MTKLLVSALLFLFAALLSLDLRAASAAKPADPEIVPCVAINSAGLIVIYRCQPDEGASYLINSLGFMLFEP